MLWINLMKPTSSPSSTPPNASKHYAGTIVIMSVVAPSTLGICPLVQSNKDYHKLSPPWEGPYIVAEVLKLAPTSSRLLMTKSSPMLGTLCSYVSFTLSSFQVVSISM